jgi:hypothetical protein
VSLIWHIALKDLRRLRMPVALWTVVIAVKLGLGFRLLWKAGDFLTFDQIALAGNWLIGIEVLAGYLLVAAVLQEDVVVGSAAFWMTRPISNGRMLAAKALALGIIFGVVPFLITLPWWLACGYGGREIVLAAAETWLWQGLVVLLAFPLGVLTGEFSRFLLWSFAVVVALSVMNMILVTGSGSGPEFAQSVNTAPARAALGSIVFCIGGFVAAVHQCFQRRLLRSLGLAGLGIATSLLLVSSAHVSRALGSAVGTLGQANPSENITPEMPNSAAQPIAIAFRAATFREASDGDSGVSTVNIVFDGVPPGYFLEAASAKQSWSWPDGFTLRRSGDFWVPGDHDAWFQELGIKRPERDPAYVAWFNDREVKAGRPPMRSRGAGNWGSVGAIVPRAFATRARLSPPSYQLHLDARLMRAVLVDEKPVRMGEVFGQGLHQARVTEVYDYYSYGRFSRRSLSRPPADPVSHIQAESVQHRVIKLVGTQPALRADHGWFIGMGTLLRFIHNSSSYFLLNRARPFVLWGDRDPFDMTACFATVEVRWETLDFTAPSHWVDEHWKEEAGWFDGPLTLAKLEARPQTWFSRELRVDRFQLTEAKSTGGAP